MSPFISLNIRFEIRHLLEKQLQSQIEHREGVWLRGCLFYNGDGQQSDPFAKLSDQLADDIKGVSL